MALEVYDEIPGSPELTDLFGYWPSFHDAEVVSVELHRNGWSWVRIHTFQTTEQRDEQGQFKTAKHVVVSFGLSELSLLQLDGFNGQNTISGLLLDRVGDGFLLNLQGTDGLDGRIGARLMQVVVEPGMPEGSVYDRRVPVPVIHVTGSPVSRKG